MNSTNMKKRTLKRLVPETWSKATFLFKSKLYQQKDSVSIGSSLGPALANIVAVAELENVMFEQLISNGA